MRRSPPPEKLGGPVWVVKAQVHAGGRGKAGGVKLARDHEAVRAAAAKMLGTRLVTKQTGAGRSSREPGYVESGSQIAREIYLSLTLNREKSRIAIVASAAGGMDIEEVAAKEPEKILTTTIHPAVGLEAYQARELGFGLGFNSAQVGEFTKILQALVPALPGAGRQPGRGQSPDRHQGRPPGGAGRQDRYRSQRAVPASGPGRPARHARRKTPSRRAPRSTT